MSVLHLRLASKHHYILFPLSFTHCSQLPNHNHALCMCQVLEIVETRPNIRKISFVAHSLGGLAARYAIGKLYKPPNPQDSSGDSIEGPSQGTICGLEAVNFITVATPHLGSMGNRQVTLLMFICLQVVWNWK